MIDCLKCVNSACCGLIVEVDREEYNHFWKLKLGDKFETRTDKFLAENPKYIKQMKEFDEIYKDNFATLKKGDDGLCVLLDRATMECTIYKDRPNVCKRYKTNKCTNIRILE
jgi:Fe-S-cluster containining protein